MPAMQTTVLPFSDSVACDRALDLLKAGRVIVAPTDTIYGVMCRYDSPDAIRQLFEVKQRPLHKAIAILIGESDQLQWVTRMPIPPLAECLAASFWPGALTLVLPARPGLPDALTAGGASIGVRMPDHSALRELMRRGGPLAATSANLSGGAETHTAEQALEQLGGLVPLILSDDSETPAHPSPASTVVDLTSARPTIIRPGPIAGEVLAILERYGDSPC